MLELRTQSERIVRRLRKGERLMLSYRGKPLAELVPVGTGEAESPLHALQELEKATPQDAESRAALNAYVSEVNEARREYGERFEK